VEVGVWKGCPLPPQNGLGTVLCPSQIFFFKLWFKMGRFCSFLRSGKGRRGALPLNTAVLLLLADTSYYSMYNDTSSVPCRPGLDVPLDSLTTAAPAPPPTVDYRGPPGPPGPPVRSYVVLYAFTSNIQHVKIR